MFSNYWWQWWYRLLAFSITDIWTTMSWMEEKKLRDTRWMQKWLPRFHGTVEETFDLKWNKNNEKTCIASWSRLKKRSAGEHLIQSGMCSSFSSSASSNFSSSFASFFIFSSWSSLAVRFEDDLESEVGLLRTGVEWQGGSPPNVPSLRINESGGILYGANILTLAYHERTGCFQNIWWWCKCKM